MPRIPSRGFLPSTGRLIRYREPLGGRRRARRQRRLRRRRNRHLLRPDDRQADRPWRRPAPGERDPRRRPRCIPDPGRRRTTFRFWRRCCAIRASRPAGSPPVSSPRNSRPASTASTPNEEDQRLLVAVAAVAASPDGAPRGAIERAAEPGKADGRRRLCRAHGPGTSAVDRGRDGGRACRHRRRGQHRADRRLAAGRDALSGPGRRQAGDGPGRSGRHRLAPRPWRDQPRPDGLEPTGGRARPADAGEAAARHVALSAVRPCRACSSPWPSGRARR